MEDRIIVVKKGSVRRAIAALNNANISFIVTYHEGNVRKQTNYYQSKMNTYSEKTRFAKSLGCKNIPEAIDKCGSRLLFEQKFAESHG